MSMILDVSDFFFSSIHAFKEGMATHSSTLAWRIPTDRGTWWGTIHGVAKSQIWLKRLSTAHAFEEHYAKQMGKHKSESPCSQGTARLLKKMRHTFQWFSWKVERENPRKQPKEFLTVWGGRLLSAAGKKMNIPREWPTFLVFHFNLHILSWNSLGIL